MAGDSQGKELLKNPFPSAVPFCVIPEPEVKRNYLGNYLAGFAAAAAVLGLLAFAAWSFLEIYPKARHLPPSREARMNEYLALDRWLEGMGIPVRLESSGDLALVSKAGEKKIFIQASLFRWNDEAVEYLYNWVREGGDLLLAFDYYEVPLESYRSSSSGEDDEEKCLDLLDKFGITINDESETDYVENHLSRGQSYKESPDYDQNFSFEVSEAEDALRLKDWTGLTRLVELKSGKGKFTAMGYPLFLHSSSLKDAPNARLAWALFASAGNGAVASGESNVSQGCLFIRGTTRVRGLVGDLFRYGNLAVLLVSLLVLLAVSFWAVIPLFGLVKEDDQEEGKSLRERFLAEGRFLKRHDALGAYCQAYLKEIKRLLAKKEGAGDDDIKRRLLEICGNPGKKPDKVFDKQDRILLLRFLEGESFPSRSFPRLIEILICIMEKI